MSPSSPTLPQAIDEFLDWVQLDKKRSTNTVDAYRQDLTDFEAFAGGHGAATVAALDRELLRAYQRHLARTRTRGTGKARPLAITTQHRRLVALRRFLFWAAEHEELLPGDLGAAIDLPKLPERLPKPLDEADREHLVAQLTASSLQELRDRALVLLLLSSGCRISEVLALDRSDWRRDNLVVTGKGNSQRPVVVTSRARAAVDAYLAARNDPSPALFISLYPGSAGTRDNRLTTSGARDICTRLSEQVGIPLFHPHQLRHTAATIVHELTGDTLTTADFLGHRGLGNVAGYAKISREQRRRLQQRLEEEGL